MTSTHPHAPHAPHAPYSSFSPGAPLAHGRELTAAEQRAITPRISRGVVGALALGLALGVMGARTFAPRVVYLERTVDDVPAALVPLLPDYAPTGEDVELKTLGATGINRDNAAAAALALERRLDIDIAALERARDPVEREKREQLTRALTGQPARKRAPRLGGLGTAGGQGALGFAAERHGSIPD